MSKVSSVISLVTIWNIAGGIAFASGLVCIGGMIQMEYQNWKGFQPGSVQDRFEIEQREHEAECFMAAQRERLQ